MTQKEQFERIYNYIINSDDKDKMHVLGNTVKSMMMNVISSNPTLAQEYIDKLEAAKWNNYLTEKESETIVSNMTPKPSWTRSMWKNHMEEFGLEKSEEPCYNEHALYTVMSMLNSDDIATIKGALASDDEASVFSFIYKLAINRLKDKDKVFDVRRYFNV